LFQFPPAFYETQVIDLADVYQELERKHGKKIELAHKSTYNPRTKKYFALSDSYVPFPGNYRRDLWEQVGTPTDLTRMTIYAAAPGKFGTVSATLRHRPLARQRRHKFGGARHSLVLRRCRTGRERNCDD
jgi:hypothetical protein